MFRICKAEFKKLFLKPSIFVVTGVLIFVLACCSFLYRPTDRTSVLVSIPSAESTKVSTFNNYLNTNTGSGTNKEGYSLYNSYLIKASDYINYYISGTDLKQDLLNMIGQENSTDQATLVGSYRAFTDAYNNHDMANIDAKRNNLKSLFENYRTYYNNNVANSSIDFTRVLSTSTINLNIQTLLSKCIVAFTETKDDINKYIIDQVSNNYKFRQNLTAYVNQLTSFVPEVEYVSSLKEYITKAEAKLGIEKSGVTYIFKQATTEGVVSYTGLYGEIQEFVKTYSTGDRDTMTENINMLKYKATCYKQTVLEVYDIITNGIQLNGLRDFGNETINQFRGFENANYYEMNENQVRSLYLFSTNTHEMDYANSFSINEPSNYKLNCFDFSYFALKICMFIIIIYTVAVAATTIVGEQSSGTIKMLAIRPYKRSKLLGGKLIASLLIGAVLLLISAVSTLTMGTILYGVNSANILVIFNATSAVALSPIFVYIIMLLTLLLEMIFFVLIALSISMIFKSQIASVAISILIYFGTLVLNTFSLSAPFLKYFPFTNVNLFKYFGSSFITSQGNFLGSVLMPSVIIGADFYFSLIYTLVCIVILTIIPFEVFKHRDIK